MPSKKALENLYCGAKISIHLNKINNVIMRYTFTCKPQDNLQQAFNELQKDLEELKQCQE